MKQCPVESKYLKHVPEKGCPGSFWQDRGDRYHCGIDIYVPFGTNVFSIDNGIVIEIGVFTSPKKVPYWNVTKYIIIKNQDNFYCKYAELDEVFVSIDEQVKAGQKIGVVGNVLNLKKINKNSPKYIMNLKKNINQSMLHFELYDSRPLENCKYLGGNWHGKTKPKNLMDPQIKLKLD